MTINERIRLLPDKLGISKKLFCKTIGIPESGFTNMTIGGKDSGMSNLVKILYHFKKIRAEWLLREDGEMFYQDNSTNGIQNTESMVSEPPPQYESAKELPAAVGDGDEVLKRKVALLIAEVSRMNARMDLMDAELGRLKRKK